MISYLASAISIFVTLPWWAFICFVLVIIFLPSSPLPEILVAATGSSSLRSSSTEVESTRFYPNIFCFLLAFWGSRLTPILASVSFNLKVTRGILGQQNLAFPFDPECFFKIDFIQIIQGGIDEVIKKNVG